MQQNMTLNNTPREEDKIVDVDQGGGFHWGVASTPYFGFSYVPQGDRKKHLDELLDIAKEIIEIFSKDRVVRLYCQYEMKKRPQKRMFKEWIPPEYNENGKVNEFKQYLIQSKREDLIWTDYMRYVSDNISFMFFPTEVRDYGRDICILQEKLDLKLAEKAGACSLEEGEKCLGVVVYPHSKIKYQQTDSKTVESYVNDKDTLIEICFNEGPRSIIIEPNPRYITYDKLMEIIKPIFEKYGWKFGNIENPFLKAFGCNVNCADCDSYCHFNFNPAKKLVEERVNIKNINSKR